MKFFVFLFVYFLIYRSLTDYSKATPYLQRCNQLPSSDLTGNFTLSLTLHFEKGMKV